jgi:hypothetical protein
MRSRTTPEQAETLAVNALGYLARSSKGLERLMDLSGLDAAAIRQRAGERDFLVAVLDFLMANEELLVDFCHDTQTEPRAVQIASRTLGET